MEIGPYIITIDDKHSIEDESADQDYLEADYLGDLLNKFFDNPELLLNLLCSDRELVIALDEHLNPGLNGRFIYEGLGRFLLERASHPDKIFFIGVSSNKQAQDYLPSPNRGDKSFYAYAAVRCVLLGEGKRYQPLSVAQTFSVDGYQTPSGKKPFSLDGNGVCLQLEAVINIALCKRGENL